MDELKRALEWHKQAVPNPTTESACVQIGCHYEEVSEMTDATSDAYLSAELERVSCEYKDKNSHYLDTIDCMSNNDKIKLLDALCDQIVTAAGIAHSLGFDLINALAEVNDSNYSKFVNGKAVFDENGKIDKPEGYRKPDLTKFI